MTGLHFPTALLIVGILFMLMPVITWLMLASARQRGQAIDAWCIGGLLVGIGVLLLALRGTVPGWVTYTLANFLIALGALLRIQSLRIDLGSGWRPAFIFAFALTYILCFDIIRLWFNDSVLRLQFAGLTYAGLFGYSSLVAWQFGRRIASRSAYWIACVSLLLGVSLALRVAEVTFYGGNPDGADSSYGASLIAITAVLSAVISHIAYAGMQLEKELEKRELAEDEFNGMLKATKDGFFIADLSGRLLQTNENLCRMLDRTREDLVSRNLMELDDQLSKQELQEKLQHIASAGFDRYESLLKMPNGRKIDVEISMTHLTHAKDRVLGFVRDISVRKQFTQELERRVLARTEELATARAEAESANAVKTRFMSNLIHEMLTPLHGILGYAELAQSRIGQMTDEQFAKYLEGILNSGKRMQKLIDSLLALVREAWDEHAGIAELELEAIAPESLALESISAVQSAAKGKHQEIRLDNQSTISAFQGHGTRLRQVLEHLLSNALNYSPEHSLVILRIQDQQAGYGASKQIVFQVIDEGCGIPEKEMQAIFEPFYESSRTATGAGKTGLGLPLCRSIVHSHKGILTAANRPEGGAIFEIRLPQI